MDNIQRFIDTLCVNSTNIIEDSEDRTYTFEYILRLIQCNRKVLYLGYDVMTKKVLGNILTSKDGKRNLDRLNYYTSNNLFVESGQRMKQIDEVIRTIIYNKVHNDIDFVFIEGFNEIKGYDTFDYIKELSKATGLIIVFCCNE